MNFAISAHHRQLFCLRKQHVFFLSLLIYRFTCGSKYRGKGRTLTTTSCLFYAGAREKAAKICLRLQEKMFVTVVNMAMALDC